VELVVVSHLTLLEAQEALVVVELDCRQAHLH
jgi:hypothetical protein